MTVRIAVRLSDEDVSFLDRLVAEHRSGSRADAVRQAVRLLRKHEEDRREIDQLRQVQGPLYPDLDGLAEAIRVRTTWSGSTEPLAAFPQYRGSSRG